METATGRIWNIQRFNVHDGAGIRTLVFFKGCPLRCWWCANPEGQSEAVQLKFQSARCTGCGACVRLCPNSRLEGGAAVIDRERCLCCGRCAALCPSQARELVGREVTVEEVLREVRKDEVFYGASGGGLTLSGGEALMQREFALELLRRAKAEYLDTSVETCGAVPWDTLRQALGLVDHFLYDIKVLDGETHRRYTGTDNALILENAARLRAAGAEVLFRTPVISGVNDDAGSIRAIGAFLREIGARDWELLPFHQLGSNKYDLLGIQYKMNKIKPIDNKAINALEKEKMACFNTNDTKRQGKPPL